jgi:hypothetical protein
MFFENMCLSGGAEGADLQWGMVAGRAGYSVRHFIFSGHRSKAPADELVVLTRDQLLAADPFLEIANKTLKRRWPVSNDWVASLLRRNYYQVTWSDAVYAISSIDKNGLVKGGTSWAVQMFIDRFEGKSCPAYVFDQDQGIWFSWAGEEGWQSCGSPPVPTGIWAGIGTRELNQNGKDAIRNLLGYTPPV